MKSFLNQKKKNTLIITSGIFCKYANEVAASDNGTSVLNIFKFKTFDKKGFIKTVNKYKKIIIYDENTESGGITPIINNCLMKYKINKNIEILTSADKQIFRYYRDRYLMVNKLNLGKKSLKKLLQNFLVYLLKKL